MAAPKPMHVPDLLTGTQATLRLPSRARTRSSAGRLWAVAAACTNTTDKQHSKKTDVGAIDTILVSVRAAMPPASMHMQAPAPACMDGCMQRTCWQRGVCSRMVLAALFRMHVLSVTA